MKKKPTVLSRASVAPLRTHLKHVPRASLESVVRLGHRAVALGLKKSLQLQKHLRQLTHRVLAAQEAERKKLSHTLQDEIAQTLLGINVRLFSLRKSAWGTTKGIMNDIASTQRLVLRSARSVRKFARELHRHQTPGSH